MGGVANDWRWLCPGVLTRPQPDECTGHQVICWWAWSQDLQILQVYLITHMKRMHISETIRKSGILHGNNFQIGWNKSKLSRKGHRKWNPSPVYRLRRGDGCQWLCGDAFNWLHDTTFAKHAMTMNGNNVTYLQRFSSMIASFSCWIKCHYSCKIVLNSYQNRNTSTVVVVGVRRGCVRCSWSQVSRLVL